jgi:hypothetical protein
MKRSKIGDVMFMPRKWFNGKLLIQNAKKSKRRCTKQRITKRQTVERLHLLQQNVVDFNGVFFQLSSRESVKLECFHGTFFTLNLKRYSEKYQVSILQ